MRTVKNFTLICLLILLQTIKISAQVQKMDLAGAPQNLSGLFSLIQEKYGYRFFYNTDVVKPDMKVTLSSSDYVLPDLLKELSTKTGLTFSIKENNLIVVEDGRKPANVPANTQASVSGTVSGTVTDSKTGETIPGVSVSIAGTTQGALTDMDGKYSLKVTSMNDTLVFSFIGFTPQKVAIKGRTTINIQLAQEATLLDEVVVTALNINRTKSSLGYSVSTLNGDQLNTAKENNVVNSLSGKVAGLSVTKASSGVDGSSRVILRGVASLLGDNRPLVVVDGIPVDNGHSGGGRWGGTDNGDALSEINAEDIESMSILKGAGAAAAYGSRGANGVILITTKKGSQKKGLGVSLNSSFLMENPLVYPEFQNSYGQGAFGTYPRTMPDPGMPWAWSYGPQMEGQSLPNYWGNIAPYNQPPLSESPTSPYTAQPNNYKDFFQTGTSFINSIALDGGNENSSVRASFTGQRSNGIVPQNTINRQTIFLRGFTKMKNILELDAKFTYIRSKSEGRPEVAEGAANPGYILSIMPRNMVDADLKTHYEDATGKEILWTSDTYTYNPYWQLYNKSNWDQKHRMQGVFSIKAIFNPKLNLIVRSGMDYTNTANHSQEAKYNTSGGLGYIANSEGTNLEWNSDFLLSYHPARIKNFQYSLSLGGNYRYNTGQGLGQWGSNLRVYDYYAISNAGTFGTSEWFSEKEVFSLYGLATFSYKNWMYLDLTMRNDWSSALPVQNNSYLYNSANLSFLFTEAFKMNSSVLTTGKLRTSYSKVGNDTGPYRTSQYFNVSQSVLPYPLGTFSSDLASYDLQPEITHSWEVGTNLDFWRGTLVLDLTYYINHSYNQLMDVPLPPSSGYTNMFMNAAHLKNTGFEVQLNAAAIQKADFTWNIIGTWSKNESIVLALAENVNSLLLDVAWLATIQARPGDEYGDIYTTDFKRDAHGNKLVNDEGYVMKGEYQKMGNINPDWMAGIQNQFTYKQFTLACLIDMRKGGNVYSMGTAYRNLFGTSAASEEGREGWYATHEPEFGYSTPIPGVEPEGYVENAINENTGQQNTVPIDPMYRNYNIWAKEIGTENVLDATNVRMREASLAYSLPKRLLSKTPLSDVQISLIGRNLFFFYNAMKDIDPESGYSSGNTGGGFEHCAIPSTRSIGCNLKINF